MFQQVRGKRESSAAAADLAPDRCVLACDRAEPHFLCVAMGNAADLTVSGEGILGAQAGQQGAVATLNFLVTHLNSSTGGGSAEWRGWPEGAASGAVPQTGWTAISRLARAVGTRDGHPVPRRPA